MKNKYTQDTLNQFFIEFKKLPYSIKIEQVKQLLENPNAKANIKINPRLKLLKIIIMTSAIIIVVATLLLWVSPKQTSSTVKSDMIPNNTNEVAQEDINQNVENEDKNIGDSLEALEVHEDKNSIMRGSSNQDKSTSQESQENTPINIIASKSDSINPIEEENNFADESISYISGFDSSFIDGITLIELEKNEYAELGFLLNDSTIAHYSRNDDCVWKIYFTDDVYGCSLVSSNLVDTTKPNFIFVSDQNGFQSLKWKCNEDVSEKWEDEFFRNKIQELIPIVLKKTDFQDLLYTDQIFWFEPSNELFNNLPSRISNDLKSEYYNFISPNDPLISSDTATILTEKTVEITSTSCDYFESCRSTLALESLKIYPNPAINSITVEFNTSEDLSGSILLLSISGANLRTLVSNSPFLVGENSYYFDLAGIKSGIYLVSINTNKGFKTQRIIVSQ